MCSKFQRLFMHKNFQYRYCNFQAYFFYSVDFIGNFFFSLTLWENFVTTHDEINSPLRLFLGATVNESCERESCIDLRNYEGGLARSHLSPERNRVRCVINGGVSELSRIAPAVNLRRTRRGQRQRTKL